ncbi:unnamed protein product [Didymodactylos carnosus]|uniref:Uncharacterized protein n=1 Tax=Didymodactylos carnosus TaxID=1234261 RepID=A0A8S2PV48_9BILA|nr:unnamed protein product [Didymodactylos carnosus]CAF4072308.1 unnamed protein product [Didymodactylos carnosus]
MSDTTKFKYLLSKMKSSLQFEVRMKKPKNLQEFLNYAQEVEALVQLSSLTTNNNNQSSTTSPTTSATIPPFVSNPNLLSSTPRPPFHDNYRNNYNSPYPSSFRQSLQSQRYSFRPQQFSRGQSSIPA